MNKAMSSSKIAIVLLLVLCVTLLVVVESDARKNRKRRRQKTGIRIADKFMYRKNRRNALEETSQKRIYSNNATGRCAGKLTSICNILAKKCLTNIIIKRSIPSDEETTPNNSGIKQRRKRTRRRRCGQWQVRKGRKCVKVTCGSCFSRCWNLG